MAALLPVRFQILLMRESLRNGRIFMDLCGWCQSRRLHFSAFSFKLDQTSGMTFRYQPICWWWDASEGKKGQQSRFIECSCTLHQEWNVSHQWEMKRQRVCFWATACVLAHLQESSKESVCRLLTWCWPDNGTKPIFLKLQLFWHYSPCGVRLEDAVIKIDVQP